MKRILLVDNKEVDVKNTIEIFMVNTDLNSEYSFITEKNLGYVLTDPNDTESFKERCEKAFILIKDNIDCFDILMIDGFLLDSSVEDQNHLVSLEVIDKVFSSSLDLTQKKIYILTGYNMKITKITNSDIYIKHKDKIVLLVRPTDKRRRNNMPDACIFRSENGKKCFRWEHTIYCNPNLSEKCTYEQCLIDTFLKAERGINNASFC